MGHVKGLKNSRGGTDTYSVSPLFQWVTTVWENNTRTLKPKRLNRVIVILCIRALPTVTFQNVFNGKVKMNYMFKFKFTWTRCAQRAGRLWRPLRRTLCPGASWENELYWLSIGTLEPPWLAIFGFNFLLNCVKYSYFKLQLVCSNLFCAAVSQVVTHIRCSIRVKMKNTLLIPEATCLIQPCNYGVLKYNWH